MSRQFPSPGGKDVAHEKRNLNVNFNIHISWSSNQLEIVFLSEDVFLRGCGLGCAGKLAWDGGFPRHRQHRQAELCALEPPLA